MKFWRHSPRATAYSCAGCTLLKGTSPGGKWGWKSTQCSDPKSCALTRAAAWDEAVSLGNLCTQTGHHVLSLGKDLHALHSPCLLFHPLFLVISPSMDMGHKTDHTELFTELHGLHGPHGLYSNYFQANEGWKISYYLQGLDKGWYCLQMKYPLNCPEIASLVSVKWNPMD